MTVIIKMYRLSVNFKNAICVPLQSAKCLLLKCKIITNWPFLLPADDCAPVFWVKPASEYM